MGIRAVESLDYQDRRNRLIPAAEAWANQTATFDGMATDDWDRAFMDRMQVLAVRAGLTNP